MEGFEKGYYQVQTMRRDAEMIRRYVTVSLLMGVILVASARCGGAEGPEHFTNTLGITFVRISEGTFVMGQDEGGDWDERPAHEVEITQPFYMAVTEVTNAQYEQFDPAHKDLRGHKPGISEKDDDAVVFVSWHDAVAFCAWLTEREGKPYRLPTEAEWEYACRAGTTTLYSTGDTLPEEYLKAPQTSLQPLPVDLTVGMTPANPWGLHDLHGNVEEWCLDWHAPYSGVRQQDPIGLMVGDFRVTRGGSHNTEPFYLRSANRASTLPEDKHWLIGFRVVQAPAPVTRAVAVQTVANVHQERYDWSGGPDPEIPYFKGPRVYVHVDPEADGPIFAKHNHCPALTACPNGDLLAIWYSTRTEPGRELAIVASRLRLGAEEWSPAAPFWDAADRNDHASALLWDGKDTLFHFNGLGTDGTWDKLALIQRTSRDNGMTWSPARLINPVHGLRNMPIAGVFQTQSGAIVLPCDAVTGGEGGSTVHVSLDGGATWEERSLGRPTPVFAAGESGPLIAGIHAGVVELTDGRLMALGRGDNIDERMPMSLSEDLGHTWTYHPSEFQPIRSGQRVVLRRLQEGPLLLVSFVTPKFMTLTDAAGVERNISGMFAALSYDDGKTWPVKRLITDDGPTRMLNGGGNTGRFLLGPDTAEPRGYLAAVQTPDGLIHLISSALHYTFNLAWITAPMPPLEQ
jgi:formylglycine-generating enzyme